MANETDTKPKKVYNKKFVKKYRERIPTLTLLDDDFFTACFKDNIECVELVVRIILEKDDLQIIEAQTQYYVDDLKGHSVRLDVFATDGKGVQYNIEVQQNNDGAIPKRARYYSSLIDAQTLIKGGRYDALAESYVIFITKNDVLEGNLPIYHIDRTIREMNSDFNDSAHIIYVNASFISDTPLGRLMADFKNAEPKSMNYEVLMNTAKYFKYDDEGVSYMCDFWEELIQEGREAGLEEGREEGRAEGREEAEKKARNDTVNNAFRMIRDGLNVDKVAAYSGLPREEVERLIAASAN